MTGKAGRPCAFAPLALAALATALAAAPARAQSDTIIVEAVFRVDIQHGPSSVVPALAWDSRLLLPMFWLLDAVEIEVADSSHGHQVTVLLQPTTRRIRFDTDSARVLVGDSVVPIPTRYAVWRDGELYVDTDLLTSAFGVAVGIDWVALTTVIARTNALPVARRVRREQARARALRRQPLYRTPLETPARRDLADGAVLEWSLTGATDNPIKSGYTRIGLGANVLGGSLELRYEGYRVPGASYADGRGSWMRAWPERQWIRQVRLGDVQSGGRRSRFLRGAVVTNQPFVRSSEFDVTELIGDLPTGWELELYDAYGLLDYATSDALGEFRVALPLRYGANPFDMVLYGPSGEVVRQRRTVRVPFSRLPAGAFEYAVGLGECHGDPCGGAFTADARYGLSHRVTAQAGWDLLTRPDQSPLWQPYGAVSAEVLPAVTVTSEAVLNGLVRAEAAYEPTPEFRVQLGQTFFDADGGRFLGSPVDRRRTEGTLLWLRRAPIATALQLSAVRSSGPGSSNAALRALFTVRKSGGRYAADLRHSHAAVRPGTASSLTVLDLNGDVVLRRGPSWLRATTVGAGIGVAFQRGLESLRAQAGRPFKYGIRAEVGLGWFHAQGLVLDVALTSTLSGPRFGSRNRFTTGAGTQGVQYADGSLLWDRSSRRVRFGDGRDIGRAGIAGLVYLDLDADGRRDPDEPGLADVPVRIGGRLTRTEPSGRFAVWDLLPFEPALVDVDTTQFDDPFFTVPHRLVEVIPAANSFVPVEIPVVVGAEVSGGVLFEGRPLPGTRVELREIRSGRVMVVTTFADGGFYTIGVPPGEYEAAIPDETLRRLGAVSAPVPFSVATGRDPKFVEAVVLFLEREPSGGNR